MYTSRNPSKSRPLSANVKRLMRLARAAPYDDGVRKQGFQITERDLIYCHKQGNLFMEAASMGFQMSEFAPLFMESQLAGVLDVSFCNAHGMENDSFSNFLNIPLLLKTPQALVEALYWIDDIIERTEEGQNKSLAITKAFEMETLRLPPALADLPEEPNRNVDDLAYAYWLGYIYRCECLLHEESSRMVYSAFTEPIMRAAYDRLLQSPMADANITDSALDICTELDQLLVEKIWPEKEEKQKRKQIEEATRPQKNTPTAEQNDEERIETQEES